MRAGRECGAQHSWCARGVFDSYETPKDCASSVCRGVRSSTISWIEGTGRVRGFE